MKKYIITGAQEFAKDSDIVTRTIRAAASGGEDMQVSDGYHTMDELYQHRHVLYIGLCRTFTRDPGYKLGLRPKVWRSDRHADGSMFKGWFILGIGTKAGEQISYHLPMGLWSTCDFAETLETGPEFDGHTPGDVLTRLYML